MSLVSYKHASIFNCFYIITSFNMVADSRLVTVVAAEVMLWDVSCLGLDVSIWTLEEIYKFSSRVP